MTTPPRTRTVTRTETYRDRVIELVDVYYPRTERTLTDYQGNERVLVNEEHTSHIVSIDGRDFSRYTGTDEQVLAKLRKGIDIDIEDAALLPELTRVIGDTFDSPRPGIKVGDHAGVYAMGRVRNGVVVKVTKTKATIAYTTRSSNGRVFRKAETIAAS